ncbi:DUF4097 family beta strand repeat-containing protein [Azotobacter beijerinckii]|uniref:Adhesin n=1 Tax=Azotobacter beijerinckii TaxID=170623 RepID=A0A1I3YEK7_9GAMM|nr:DUF4097 family beta strand repeat-containing protein [Azotobacter beijerinckii]SFA78214.1 Putative adhesin [Azotobacter beijerinckii]SFK29809.1 Putative adhesin [Azotobacter beijerinckii]
MNKICLFSLTSFFGFLSTTNTLASNLIDINVISEDVFLEKSNNKEPSITDNTDKSQVKVSIERQNGDLYISSKGVKNSISNAGQLIIHVPEGYEIKAKGMSSSFMVNFTCGDEIKVKSMSGDIRSNCLAKSQTHFESMNGDIRVSAVLAAGMHLLSSMSGDVDAILKNGSRGKVAATSEKGMVQINQERVSSGKLVKQISETDTALVAKTISGDATIEF